MASLHDALFKYAFSDVEEAASLLRSALPAELVADIDWSALDVVPGSFVATRSSSASRPGPCL